MLSLMVARCIATKSVGHFRIDIADCITLRRTETKLRFSVASCKIKKGHLAARFS
jgi:hypothetical protein